jgi:hypothetical protein
LIDCGFVQSSNPLTSSCVHCAAEEEEENEDGRANKIDADEAERQRKAEEEERKTAEEERQKKVSDLWARMKSKRAATTASPSAPTPSTSQVLATSSLPGALDPSLVPTLLL